MTTEAQIIRQACLKAAASALSGSGVSAPDVCNFAGELERWVYAAGGEQAVVTELKAVPVQTAVQQPKSEGAAGVPTCPKCGGDMWDNRRDKRNPKAPDFKCKNKDTCGHGIWT